MHRLNLDTTSEKQPKIPVDDQPLSADNQVSSEPMVRQVELNKSDRMPKKFNSLLIFGALAVVAGIGTGFGTYKLSASQSAPSNETVTAQPVAGAISKGDVFGSSNTDTFKDSAMGYLEAGGLDGEGSHKLLRPGGVSQTVYLTSSVTDLDKLVGMDVKIWGETFKGQKAGWLMDVGRIEVVDPKGTKPVEK